jgi:hypothetical protein
MKKLLLAATAFSLLSIGAQALPLTGTLVLGAAGVPTINFAGGTGSFGGGTTTTFFGGTGDFAALNGFGTLAGAFSFSTSVGGLVAEALPTFAFSTFLFTPDTVVTTAHSSSGSGSTLSQTLGLYLHGTSTGNDNDVSLTLSFTKTAASNWSYSGTLATPAAPPPPPIQVPEPVSMAILGAGLLGLGLVRRRHG